MSWQEKPGPIFRRSRLWHFGLGFAGCALAGHLGGPRYACLGAVAISVLGYAWEALNGILKMGPHPFGSPWDFAFFYLGAGCALILVLVLP